MEFAIETDRLTRYYGQRVAVEDLSLKIPAGSVFALLGRNGSGKSTTMRMILGLLAPTRGHCAVFGHDSQRLPNAIRSVIGYVPEGHPLYRWMRTRDCSDLQRRQLPRWNETLFRTVVDAFRISARTQVHQLSRGQRAGLSLAMAIAQRPDLLVLDDPSMGLDPVAQRALVETLSWFTRAKHHTVLIATHSLADVERLADWVVVLEHSVLRACAPLEVLRSRIRRFVLHFTEAPPQLDRLAGQLTFTRLDHELQVTVANPSDLTRRTLMALNPSSFIEEALCVTDALLAYLAKGASTALHFPDLDGAN